ncbi:MAG: hypothetical protein ACM3O8_03870 [Methylococcaceae bacterium]|nr:hypothetical protein [Prolixibacteraceae bacterium]
MKKYLLIVCLVIMIFGCNKDENEPVAPETVVLEPYIKNLILPDTKPPYSGSYYIHVDFSNLNTSEKKELTFSEMNQNMTSWYNPSDVGLGMSIQGVIFSDAATSEELEIAFYFNTNVDSTFNMCYANYFFSDPWRHVAGANIHYFIPVNTSDSTTKNMYLGTNTSESYFEITYIGNNRLNGTFHTTWKECCGGTGRYDVSGDFSIPDIRYFYQ